MVDMALIIRRKRIGIKRLGFITKPCFQRLAFQDEKLYQLSNDIIIKLIKLCISVVVGFPALADAAVTTVLLTAGLNSRIIRFPGS